MSRKRFPTDDHLGPTSVVARLAACIEELQAQQPGGDRGGSRRLYARTGQPRNRTLLDPPNIPGLHHTPLAALLSAQLGVPGS